MKQYDEDFLNCLEGLETKMIPPSKKEIDDTFRAVIKRTGLKRKMSRTKRAGRILLIAAAVAACGAVTAAASGINLGGLFRGYFERSDPNGANGAKPVVSLTESQVETLNKSGAVLNQSVTDKGTTVTVKAAVGDKSDAYILLDIAAPEGTVLDEDKYEFEDIPIDFHNIADNKGSSAGWDISTQKDDNPNDNKKSFVIRISCAGIDLQNREIDLTLKDLSVPTGKLTFRSIVEGEWKFHLKLNYNTFTKKVEMDKVTHFKDNYCTIQTVEISSLSVNIVYTNPKPYTGPIPESPDLMILFKDGTQKNILPGPGTGTKENSTMTYQFSAPLDFDKVEKITVGDVEIPVK
jgi:hypothetical protein